ncbi:MAG: SGNH/GDSL hydrolase family protein [Solirubrobacteraceae bacterium]
MAVTRRARLVAVLGVVLAVVACATIGVAAEPADPSGSCAGGPVTGTLIATTNYPGIIVLHYVGAEGATVTFYECEDEGPRTLGSAQTPHPDEQTTELSPATWWRCDRLVRRFAATVTLPDGRVDGGITDVRTMSCAHRFELRAPAHVARGAMARIRVVDRWNQGGVLAKVCATPPGKLASCRRVSLGVGINVARAAFRMRSAGRWRVSLRAPHARLHQVVAVGPHARPTTSHLPVVLATGDSTMMGTESFLADDLEGRADVISEVFPGASIGANDSWLDNAVRQVGRLRPPTTVLSIGANEGWTQKMADGDEVTCCNDPWGANFQAIFERALRTYLQQGHAKVIVLTQPAPRDPDRVPIVNAVNKAIVGAGNDLAGVTVLRMDLLFSPHGFQKSIVYRGRRVVVREPDGVHLNAAGTAIAASVAADAVLGRTSAPG